MAIIKNTKNLIGGSLGGKALSAAYANSKKAFSSKDIIYLNQNLTDPALMLSGDINGEVVQWIRNNSHRYLGKYQSDGSMALCQLSDVNSNYYSDGSASVLTGSEGDVFMKLPVFYWSCVEIFEGSNIWRIMLSKTAFPGCNKWGGDKELIGIYEAINSGNKLYSRSGSQSSGDISQSNFKTYARSRGQGFTIVTWEWNCIMAMLYYCQYGHMNCQAKIGSGTSNYTKTMGETNALGMKDTVAGVDGDSMSINFWGLENWWGNKWEWIDNVIINQSVVDDTWRITDYEGNERTVYGMSSAASESYIKQCLLDEHFDLIPTVTGGSSSSSYCDAHWYTRSVGRVVKRGGYSAFANGGVANSFADYGASVTNALSGSRLAFHGNQNIINDVETFKALPVLE